jgi:hypothetical protein
MATRSELFLDKKVFGCRVTQLAVWVIGGILLTAISLVTFLLSGDGKFLTTGFVLGLGTTFVPLGVKAGHLMFTELGGLLDGFLISEIRRPEDVFFSLLNTRLKRMGIVYFVGAAFGALALIAFAQGGAFDFGGQLSSRTVALLKTQMAATIGIAGFVSGVGLSLMVTMASVVWELGDFKVKLAPHKFGVCTVGSTLLKIYTMTAAIWLVFSCSAVVGLRDIFTPLASLAGVSLVVFLVSFPVCLLPLHRAMVEQKRTRVQLSYGLLERLGAFDLGLRDDLFLRVLGEAKREYQEALDLPEWPFGWKAIIALATSGIVPNLPAIISFASTHLVIK